VGSGNAPVGRDASRQMLTVGAVGLTPDPTLGLLAVSRLLLGGSFAGGLLGGLFEAARARLDGLGDGVCPRWTNLGGGLGGGLAFCNLLGGHCVVEFVRLR
jgi:hypothetical protein